MARKVLLRDADALYCPECERIIGDRCQPYCGMSNTKGMHERGTGHKPIYIRAPTDNQED